ncbi:MAG: MFS transporter [Gemmatimonadaceae bacterium]|nr:MFS transporter [Gemmatimonadaceae bacterium]
MTSTRSSAPPPWPLAALLMLANTFSFIDRTLLTLLVAPIRAELGISDTVISLLHGLTFATLYAVMGLPLGRWADRGDRPTLMAGGVALWSGMTVASGLAASVGGLAVARAGVAVGEASLAPAAVSLLAERMPQRLVARAIALFQSGIFIGSASALFIGGALLRALDGMDRSVLGPLAGFSPWRLVFMAVGAPGVLIALMLLRVHEPRRTTTRADAPPAPSLQETFAFILAHRRLYGWHVLAFTAITVLAYGAMAWMPSVLVRSHGVTTATAGLWLGGVLMIAAPAGVMASGALVDRALARGEGDGPIRVALAGVALLGVAVPVFALAPTFATAIAADLPLAFGLGFPYGIASGSLALVTPVHLRGQVIALYLLVSNLIGLSCGPLLIALCTDHLFHQDAAVRYSLALLPLLTVPLAMVALRHARAPFADAWRARPA